MRTETQNTAYGPVEVTYGYLSGGVEVAHVSRHGKGHSRLSNHVTHLANLAALVDLDVKAVISLTVCGAVDPDVALGSVVVFDDLYYPSNRLPDGTLCTWHSKAGLAGRGHWIFDRPFSEPLRQALIDAGREGGIDLTPSGCYGHVDGPRFNTRAEILGARNAGVTAVSQTAGPEVVLAGEAGIPLALIGFVTDYANGVVEEPQPIEELIARVGHSTEVLTSVVGRALVGIEVAELEPTGIFYRFEP